MLEEPFVRPSVVAARNKEIQTLGVVFAPGIKYRKGRKVYGILIRNTVCKGLRLLLIIDDAPWKCRLRPSRAANCAEGGEM